jgi:CHAD domain-containing protein
MSLRLPSDLLRRSAEEASRLVALAYLDEIARAEPRLADPLDAEALHDFRVGLRRLRSCTRAYRTQLKGSVSKKMRRRLRDLTQATNAGRDAEVQLAWLREQATRLEPGDTEGLAWLIGRLEGRKYEALEAVTSDVARRFNRTATKLKPRLQTFRIEVRTGKGQEQSSFAQVTGGLIRSHAADLANAIRSVSQPEDVSESHVARIRAKRLRYLLEPLSRRAPGVKSLVERLKELQNLLGGLHDMQVMGEEITSSLSVFSHHLADRQAGPVPGLRALEQLARDHASSSYQSFKTRWADGKAARFFGQMDDLRTKLEQERRDRVDQPARKVARAGGARPVEPAAGPSNGGGHHVESVTRPGPNLTPLLTLTQGKAKRKRRVFRPG